MLCRVLPCTCVMCTSNNSDTSLIILNANGMSGRGFEGLAEWLIRQVSAMGFKEPTPVQAHCIPPILEGKTVTLFVAADSPSPPEMKFGVQYTCFSLIFPHREGLYWLCKDWQWKDCCICTPHLGQIVSRPLWHLCPHHHPN